MANDTLGALLFGIAAGLAFGWRPPGKAPQLPASIVIAALLVGGSILLVTK